MEAKLTKLTHKIAIQLHLGAEGCTICSSRTRRPVRKLLDTTSHASHYLKLPQFPQFIPHYPKWPEINTARSL